LGVAKFPINLDFFKRETPKLLYFLGFVAADGSIIRRAVVEEKRYTTRDGVVKTYISSHSDCKIEVALKEEDQSLLELFRDAICPGKPLYYRVKQKAFRLVLCGQEVVDIVESYGIGCNKTHNLTISDRIKNSLYFRDFIRGYFDGDGTIGIKMGRQMVHNVVRYYYGPRVRLLGTYKVLEVISSHIADVCQGMNKVSVRQKGKENVYYIEYSFANARKFLEYIYLGANWKLERKYKQFMDIAYSDSDTLGMRYNRSPQICVSL